VSAPGDEAVDLDPAPLEADRAAAESQPRRSSRSRRRLVFAALVAATVAIATSLVLRPGDAENATPLDPGVATIPGDADQSSARSVEILESALQNRDRVRFLSAWDGADAAQERARTLYDNLIALRAEVHLDALPTAHAPDDPSSAGPGWNADVDVSWRLRGVDKAPAHTTLVLHFDETDDGARVVDAAQADSARRPIWLMGPLTVMRHHRTIAAGTDPDLVRLVDQDLVQAQADLTSAGLGEHGPLVAYVAPTQQDFERMVGTDPGRYDHIAGINAPVGPSSAPRAPQMIAINPDLFAELDPRGRRVIMTHEATHYATGAARSVGPTWLVEGYADYVALSAAHVPLRVSVGGTQAYLRDHGLPHELPAQADFSEQDPDTTLRSYALSMLAVRFIADEYGQSRLDSFYTDVVTEQGSLGRAVHDDLSTSIPALTKGWRASLRELIDAG
jgi:hypothetical protein